jgi:hypothetical protein
LKKRYCFLNCALLFLFDSSIFNFENFTALVADDGYHYLSVATEGMLGVDKFRAENEEMNEDFRRMKSDPSMGPWETFFMGVPLNAAQIGANIGQYITHPIDGASNIIWGVTEQHDTNMRIAGEYKLDPIAESCRGFLGTRKASQEIARFDMSTSEPLTEYRDGFDDLATVLTYGVEGATKLGGSVVSIRGVGGMLRPRGVPTPRLGARLGSGGRAVVHESLDNPNLVIKTLKKQPANVQEAVNSRLREFKRAEEMGLLVEPEIPIVTKEGVLYWAQKRLPDVDYHDPLFRKTQRAAEEMVEKTRIYFDVINPANWGLRDGLPVLRDP